jgi:hypothetical protein
MQFLFVTVIPKYLKFTDFQRNIKCNYITVVSCILVRKYVDALSSECSILGPFQLLFFILYFMTENMSVFVC